MVSCWSKHAEQRPPMAEVEKTMDHLAALVSGADIPLAYPAPPRDDTESLSSAEWSEPAGLGTDPSWGSQRQATSLVLQGATNTTTQARRSSRELQMSAPASLSCSSEDLHRLAELSIHGGAAGDALASTPSWTPGHRRVGSAGSQQCNVPSASGDQGATPTSWASGRRTSGHPHPSVHPAALSRPDPSRKTSWPATPDCPQEVDLGLNAHLLIEPALQPLSPVPSCQESVRIFDDHRCLAQWYFKLQSEICLLNQRSKELDKELEGLVFEPQRTYYDEAEQLEKEQEQLKLLRESLKNQLQRLKQQQRGTHTSSQPGSGKEDWVMVSLPQ